MADTERPPGAQKEKDQATASASPGSPVHGGADALPRAVAGDVARAGAVGAAAAARDTEVSPQRAAGAAPGKPTSRVKAPLRSREPIWSLRKPLPRAYQFWVGLALPLILLVTWVALTSGAKPVIGALFLPAPLEVLRVLVRDLLTGDKVLLDAAMVSTLRITAAFVVATAVALPLGIAMGAFEPINRFIDPIMAPLRYMPISAFIPLTILWFGIGERQKISFLFLGVFVYLLPVVITAIRAVPEELVQTARTLGASRMQVVRTVLLPAAIPDIFDSFRVMNAISWTYVILAEFVNTTRGLGYLIKLSGDRLKTAEMFAGVIIIGVIGLATDALIRGLGRLMFPWREGA